MDANLRLSVIFAYYLVWLLVVVSMCAYYDTLAAKQIWVCVEVIALTCRINNKNNNTYRRKV